MKVGTSLTCDVDEGRGVLEPDDTVAPSQHQAHTNHTSHCMSHSRIIISPLLTSPYTVDSNILRQTTMPSRRPASGRGTTCTPSECFHMYGQSRC